MDKNKIIEGAAKLVAKGAYDKAIKEYQKILDADPKDVRILQKVGELYQKKNDTQQAVAYFTKVAQSYSSDGFFLKAVALYKQVLKISPDLVEVNLELADLHQRLELMSEAMAYYQTVANAYDKAGNTRASLDTLKKMLDLDPDNVASRIKLAELYAREKMNDEAVTEFRQAAEYLEAHHRTDDHLRVIERISALEPNDVALAKQLAKGYLGHGDQKRALAKLQVCFKTDPQDVETLQMLADAFFGLGQIAKTISVYKELVKIAHDAGHLDEARRLWEKISELDPEDADLASRRAAAHPAPAAPAPAPRPAAPVAASPAPAAAPAPAPAPRKDQLTKLLTETDVYVKYGLHEKALEHLRRVFAVDPENLEAHEKAYQIYVSAKQGPQAAEQLLNVLRLCTRRSEAARAGPYLDALLKQDPGHPELPAFMAVLRPGGEIPEATAVEIDDELLVDPGDDELVVDGEDELVVDEDGPAVDLALETAVVGADEVVEDAFDGMTDPGLDEPLTIAEDEPLASSVDLALEDEVPEPLAAEDLAVVDDDLVDEASEVFDLERTVPGLPTVPPSTEPSSEDVTNTFVLQDEEEPAYEPEPVVEEEPAYEPEPVVEEEPAYEPEPIAEAEPAYQPEPIAEAEPAYEPEPVAEEEPAYEPEPASATTLPEVAAVDPVAEECDEASFFLEQGLYDDAREILEVVLIARPGHARATELLARLERLESGGDPSDISDLGPEPATQAEAAPGEATGDAGKGVFDLAAELADELGELGEVEPPSEPVASEDFQYSVEEVFSEFKKGVAKVVKAEDVDTHYDLGIAYKEMGLTEDAIGEFETARKGCVGKKKELDCLAMIGALHLEKGEWSSAVEPLETALGSEHAKGEAAKGLRYDLAVAKEQLGDLEEALAHFQEIARTDKAFRDVSAQVARLSGQLGVEEEPTDPGHPPPNGAARPRRPSGGAHARPSKGASESDDESEEKTDSQPPGGKTRKVGYL